MEYGHLMVTYESSLTTLKKVHPVTIQNIFRDGGGTITTVELGQVRKSTTFRNFNSGILGF